MKLGDVKIGEHYRAKPNHSSSYYRTSDRWRAEGIETVEVKTGWGASAYTRKVRKIKVRPVDPETGVAVPTQGEEGTRERIEWQRQWGPRLVGGAELLQPWSEYADAHAEHQRVTREAERRETELQDALDKLVLDIDVGVSHRWGNEYRTTLSFREGETVIHQALLDKLS